MHFQRTLSKVCAMAYRAYTYRLHMRIYTFRYMYIFPKHFHYHDIQSYCEKLCARVYVRETLRIRTCLKQKTVSRYEVMKRIAALCLLSL
jgi:hypothetical protein